MTTVNVYLTFNGNCEDAFKFYQSVFGGEFSYLGRFNEMPPMPDAPQLNDDEAIKIMHISLPISSETILMGSDINPQASEEFIQGTNFAVSIDTDSRELADKYFKALSEGGYVFMPMADMFWGSYFGMTTDKFGIRWMIGVEQSS